MDFGAFVALAFLGFCKDLFIRMTPDFLFLCFLRKHIDELLTFAAVRYNI